jgi:hypothetical protein
MQIQQQLRALEVMGGRAPGRGAARRAAPLAAEAS